MKSDEDRYTTSVIVDYRQIDSSGCCFSRRLPHAPPFDPHNHKWLQLAASSVGGAPPENQLEKNQFNVS